MAEARWAEIRVAESLLFFFIPLQLLLNFICPLGPDRAREASTKHASFGGMCQMQLLTIPPKNPHNDKVPNAKGCSWVSASLARRMARMTTTRATMTRNRILTTPVVCFFR
ncbi:hypothetical protein AK812_SmicGene42206 [Symbiodinium microadriaticum]|uniref:Uncharacterized protein n=1 Tax=Symbiodinium microadriaticum TaxID=2951 RepID=A0A1Q9C459_SYMMI|nr:hypothetical protein AK812_SmicGene42206 [Symbiodinium microadriaticum]